MVPGTVMCGHKLNDNKLGQQHRPLTTLLHQILTIFPQSARCNFLISFVVRFGFVPKRCLRICGCLTN